jgi:hypothetical protein
MADFIARIETPADPFRYTEKSAARGLTRRMYKATWGSLTDPYRIHIIISTMMKPDRNEDGSTTVLYSPMCLHVRVNGKPFEHYVGTGLYQFHFTDNPGKPVLLQDLAVAFDPLSTPVRPAPCVTGLHW